MLNTITSLFKPRAVAAPPAPQINDTPDLHLAGRGKSHGKIAQMAVEVVKAGGVWSAKELVEYLLGANDKKAADYVSIYLQVAWKRGEVARGEVHQRPGQGRPSVVRYAADWRVL
ncbi:MAG: hypothetical protein RLZ51_1877 [Pseudomonadota bacterium]|jgi:hypothetical protein